MAARPSASREPSLLSANSRRSSLTSNPDIFSDDYALEPIDLNLDFSLEDDHDTEENGQTSSITPYPAIPSRLSVHHRPSSTAKRTNADDSNASIRDGGSIRTSSTSSRVSRIRAQSPYRGPTAPSHPYAMYPQITRASSIASQSTIRPPERPFVHTGGPEHPYGLYAQNTVENDEDEDIGTQPIPPGFSALGYGSPQRSSNTEVGDIVLSDGHIEQLPPYTRYADNIIAKGNMNDIDETRTVEMDTTSSERASLMRVAPPSIRRSLPHHQLSRNSQTETRQPRWRQTAHKRVCGGIALWLLILISVAVILAALLGGVVGGVVGRKQGATEAQKSDTDTGTVTWDETTNASIPACPTGRYSIPFNSTQEISSCVATYGKELTWGCLDIAYIGMTIGENPDKTSNVQFDDYSVNTKEFMYGPQPPDFNGSTISLEPRLDTDHEDLGIALFFRQEFNKLIILPGFAFQPNQERSVSGREIRARGRKWDKIPLVVGEQPWYCFWNSTISEFWIYLEQGANGTKLSSTTVTGSPPSSTSTPPPTSVSSPSPTSTFPKQNGYGNFYDYPNTRFQKTWSNFPLPTPRSLRPRTEKRSYNAPYLPLYPRLVKMVEKRRPIGNTQPYCQQMRVLVNGDVVPQEGSEILKIEEFEWDDHPVVVENQKRDATGQMESNCVCEWISI